MGTVPSIHTIFLSPILLLMLLKPCFMVALLAFPPPPSSLSREGAPPASAISLQIPNDSSASGRSYEHAISFQGLYMIESQYSSLIPTVSMTTLWSFSLLLLGGTVTCYACVRMRSQACYRILDIVDQQIYAPINQTEREKKRSRNQSKSILTVDQSPA